MTTPTKLPTKPTDKQRLCKNCGELEHIHCRECGACPDDHAGWCESERGNP